MANDNLKVTMLAAAFVAQLGGADFAITSYLSGSKITGDCFAYTPKKKSFMKSEMKKEFALKKNLANFNRASGLLTDILREQKKLFNAQSSAGVNNISLEAENLLNEANLYASDKDYDKGYEALEAASTMLIDSIEKLNRQ